MNPFAHVPSVTRLDRSGAQAALERSGVSARPGAPATIADLMPRHYEAHARLLPRLPVVTAGHADERRWAGVLGRLPGPGQLVPVVRATGLDLIVRIGEIDRLTAGRIVAVLTRVMDTGDCYFHYAGRSFEALPDPADDELVYAGPLTALTELTAGPIPTYEAPTTMWPPDGSWCFALWTDSVAAYVGGPARLVDGLVADADLEADPVRSGAPIDDWTSRV